jgi:hypothetical protein
MSERSDYDERMDNLMFRVCAVLDGEHSFDVAGIGFALIMRAMEDMTQEGRDRVRGWITECLVRKQDTRIH